MINDEFFMGKALAEAEKSLEKKRSTCRSSSGFRE